MINNKYDFLGMRQCLSDSLIFQSLVSSECSRLVEAATEKLSVKVEEQNSEIRKLKAMIGENLSLD